MGEQYDLAALFEESAEVRISTFTTPAMMAERLRSVFGNEPDFSADLCDKMRDIIRLDLLAGRRENYNRCVFSSQCHPPTFVLQHNCATVHWCFCSTSALLLLWERAGGFVTRDMRVVAELAIIAVQSNPVLGELRQYFRSFLPATAAELACGDYHVRPNFDIALASASLSSSRDKDKLRARVYRFLLRVSLERRAVIAAAPVPQAVAVLRHDNSFVSHAVFYGAFLARHVKATDERTLTAIFHILDNRRKGFVTWRSLLTRATWCLEQYPQDCSDLGSLLDVLVEKLLLPLSQEDKHGVVTRFVKPASAAVTAAPVTNSASMHPPAGAAPIVTSALSKPAPAVTLSPTTISPSLQISAIPVQPRTRTLRSAISGCLWGAFIGDSLSMPVHWYYSTERIAAEFGLVTDYRAPSRTHPTCGGMTAEAAEGVIGTVINFDKKKFWRYSIDAQALRAMRFRFSTAPLVSLSQE
jgi:hypothetical protein